jgi:Spy/CpxP family protein refolding chaperone
MSEPVRPLRRARLLSAALLVVVFVAGTLVGAATDRAIGAPDSHKRGRHGMETELLERLRLDERQEREVETILERRRAEAAEIWSEVKPRLNQVLAATRDDLSRVLTPEQLEEYDRLMAERSRRKEARHEAGRSKGGS